MKEMEVRKEQEEFVAEEANGSNMNEKSDYSIWEQIIFLHTKTGWKNFVIISTVILQFQLILYDISFRERTAFPKQSDDLSSEQIAMDGVYAFDVLSAIIYKKWKSFSSTYDHPTRSIKYLVIDVISLLPFDLVHRLITHGKNPRVSYLLSMNHLLRIHRLFSFFNEIRSNVGHRRIFIRVFEFVILLLLMTGVSIAGMINTVDMVNLDDVSWLKIIKERSSYPKNEFEWCIISYYVMMTQISGHGLPEVYPGAYSFAFIVIVLSSLWILQAFEIAYLTDIISQRDYSRSLFHQEMHLMTNYLEDMNASKETRDNVKKYYNYFWKMQGNSDFEIMKFNMYPTIFLKECALELTWDAYKHSHLFRDQPIPFLRDLAIYFEREYYRPGDVIIKKYERKSKFIYAVSGIVQLLSEEDDKSPILSFSGGTILCESTLILSHRSLCNVVARTEVELNVLRREKFVQLMVYRYQTIYRIIQSKIRFRYWKALRMATIGAALQKKKSHIVNVPACTDVAWLKHTLTVLQNRHNRVVTKKEKKDLHPDAIFAATDFRYTFANLDMLVISDDKSIVTENVCLNNGRLPWIFYPQSTILKFWRGFVLMCCFALTLAIPTYVSQPKYQIIELSFFVHSICLIYLFDLVIVSSTAIHENDTVRANIIDIISKRMYNATYWADVVAAFPLDWILSLFGSNDPEILAFCKLTRLVKIYKFEQFFSSLENRMILGSFKLRVIKYTFYMLTITYFSSACILLATCRNGECEPSGWLQTFIAGSNADMKGMTVTAAFLYASQVLVGIGTDVVVPKVVLEYSVTIPLLIMGAVIFNYVISSIAASQVLGGLTKSWLRFNTMNIALMLDLNRVSKPIQDRVFRYLEMEWLDNNAYVLAFKRDIFDGTTPKLRKELNAERFSSLIRGVDLFQEMDEECVKDICLICKLRLLPPKEVVGYRGNECRTMCIVEKGHCQIWKNVEASPIDVSQGKALYVIEMLCNLRNFYTVTTVTHVSIVQIVMKDLMQILAQFPMERSILMKVLKKFKMSTEFTRLLTFENTLPRHDMMTEIEAELQQIEKSPKTEGNPNPEGNRKSKIMMANDVPANLSWKETVLMFFLLKSTISPDGKFIKIWEGVRCSCAYILIALYSADAVFSQIIPELPNITVTFVLNIMMVIDLYMQLHVQYYNNHRVLVTHPLLTAKKYVKTGLIVDVMAVFPFEHFFISKNFSNPRRLWFCRLNKLLMAHRIFGALRYQYSWPYMPKYINCVIYLPVITLAAHVLACGLFLELCEVGDNIEKSDNFVAGIYCSPKNVQIKYKIEDHITPIQMYIYSILYTFATITKIGGVNLNPMRYTGILYVLFMTLVSFLLLMIVSTYTVSTISRRDAKLTAYQEQMMILMSYLKEKKVSIEFRDKVVNYFETFWILKRGTSIVKQMQLFPPDLREDVLWCTYGPSLTKSPGFSKMNEPFFRSLFNYVDVKFYSKGSAIVKVNRVHSLVHFIHSGWAEAIGPDGTRMEVLGCGSIFGNFTGSSTMRQTCSIVSRTHVEAIVITSSDFYDLMIRHPKTRKSFLSVLALNTDYLRAESEAEETEVVIFHARKKPAAFILLPNTGLVETWEILSVLFSCYSAFAVCTYHVAVTKFAGFWLMIPYGIDFVFLLKIGLVFFTAFEDDLGDYVLDQTLIAKRFRESKLGLYLHIFTIIPFEVFSLFIRDTGIRSKAFAWLRMNRVLRLILVINYFRTACNRLNINITIKRILYAAVLLVSLLHVAACTMIICQNWTNEDTTILEGMKIYVDNFYIVSVMFTIISPRYVPKNSQEALCSVFIFIVFYTSHAILLGEVCAVVDVNQFIMNEYERKITFFRDRLARLDLTYVLQVGAWSYSSKLWKLRRGQQTPRLINEAPICLQYSILNEMYAHHLLDNEVFGNLHEDFIRQLTFHFKDILFFPGDRIVNIGDIDETMYFIDNGTVEINSISPEPYYSSSDDNPLSLVRTQLLGPGQSFGIVQGLYEGIPHTATYTSKTITHIIYLYQPNWIYLLKYFPVTTENLYKWATRIIRSEGLEAYV